jgi:hypothetical protein
VEANFSGEGAIVLELGVAIASGLIHLVVSSPGEVNARRAVMAIQAALDRAEGEFTASVRIKPDVTGREQVDELGIPEFHLRDPPLPDQRMLTESCHGAASSNLGNRIRLAAAAVSVTIHPTRASPRWRVLRRPATALIQPNGSSIRLRMRWLIA